MIWLTMLDGKKVLYNPTSFRSVVPRGDGSYISYITTCDPELAERRVKETPDQINTLIRNADSFLYLDLSIQNLIVAIQNMPFPQG